MFSLGYDDLSSALAGDIGWQLAAVLLVAKFIATFTCYGFGGCGGIFSPTLVLRRDDGRGSWRAWWDWNGRWRARTR